MNNLSKYMAGLSAVFAVSASAHPGHEHTVQSSYHMLQNNLLIVAGIVGVLLAARFIANRD